MKKAYTAVSRGIGYKNILISFTILTFILFIHFYTNKPPIILSITVLLVVVASLLFGYALGTHRQKGRQTLVSDLIPGEVYQVISLTRRQGLGIHRAGFLVELALLSARSQGGMRDHETLILKLIGSEMSFDPGEEFVMMSPEYPHSRLVSIYRSRTYQEEELATEATFPPLAVVTDPEPVDGAQPDEQVEEKVHA